jgi:hypothetical protein
MATIPLTFAQTGWYSIPYVAKRLNRPQRTVYHWAVSGLFTRMGIKVISIPTTSGRRLTWIFCPEPSRFAKLRKLAIDIPHPSTIPSQKV